VTLHGAVAKGPFVQGSSVTVSPVDGLGNPSGTNYPTSTIDDVGQFNVAFNYVGPVLLTGSGYYYNEVSGALSGSSLTLKALANIDAAGTQNAYINLVTHLTFNRVTTLLGQGKPFADAITQAESELRAAIAVGSPTFDPGAKGSELNLLGGDNVAASYVFAVSSVFAEAAQLSTAQGSLDAKLQELLNTTSSAFASGGTIPAATKTALDKAQRCVQPYTVEKAFAKRLSDLASNTVVPDIDRALDSDLDGIPNLEDNCPLVANANQAAVNGFCAMGHGQVDYSFNGGVGGMTDTVVADLDGASGGDIVLVTSSKIVTWLNGGGGNFAAPTAIDSATTLGFDPAAYTSIDHAEIADISGDGHPDLVVAYTVHPNGGGSATQTFAYLPGDGAGNLGSAVNIFQLSQPMGPPNGTCSSFSTFRLAQLNGDSKLDFIGYDPNCGIGISVAPANGAWPSPTTIALPSTSYTYQQPCGPGGMTCPQTGTLTPYFNGIAIGDFKEDGKVDIVLSARTNSTTPPGGGTVTADGGLFTFIGNGDGTFQKPVSETTFGTYLSGLDVGDFDNDGHRDLVTTVGSANINAAGVLTVVYGDGASGFSAPATIGSVTNPCGGGFGGGGGAISVVVGDFTGDGKDDLFLKDATDLATSNGRTFGAPVYVNVFGSNTASGGAPDSFASGRRAADLDGNGTADIAISNGFGVVFATVNPKNGHSW
jgi:hypothetical protein